MSKIAVLDLETTGFAPDKDFIVEVGIVEINLYDGSIQVLYDELVKEDGLSEIHASSWIFKNSDLPFNKVMQAPPLDKDAIQKILNQYPVTAYNKAFDFKFLRARGIQYSELDCPMLLATDICKLPGRFGKYKWPTVEEAWQHFFADQEYKELHRGADDAAHEAKIIHQLYKMGVFKLVDEF